jgi:hypothetical protein
VARAVPHDRSVQRTVRVVGAAPVDVVWERYAEPARWARWAPQIRRVDTPAARIAPGVTGRVQGPPGVAVAFVIGEVDEQARTWAWDVRCGPVRLHLRHGVEADPRGAATWLTIRGSAPVVLAYLPVAGLALRRLVRP